MVLEKIARILISFLPSQSPKPFHQSAVCNVSSTFMKTLHNLVKHTKNTLENISFEHDPNTQWTCEHKEVQRRGHRQLLNFAHSWAITGSLLLVGMVVNALAFGKFCFLQLWLSLALVQSGHCKGILTTSVCVGDFLSSNKKSQHG